jgi:glycosyltransferase involved in cell wall biosynthesis
MSSSAWIPIHAFIDLSRCVGRASAVEIEWLRRMDALGGCVERATIAAPEKVALPNRWTQRSVTAVRACEQAFFGAADAGAHLLVVFDGARPTSDAIDSLAATLALDPLFGVAHPRFSDAAGQRISPAMESGVASQSDVARGVLAMLPGFYITTECLSPCFLICRDLVTNLAPTIEGWIDARGLLAEYSTRVRRLGFRTVISNRAVVLLHTRTADSAEVQPDARDVAVIRSTFPELERARREFSRVEVFEGERLISQFFDGPERWLLDGRNLVGRATVNGTVKAILGICDGLYAARRGPEMTLWVTAAAAVYHGLERRYAGWQIVTSPPGDRFGAALRLTQPLQLTEALDLHVLAPVNVFLMLDTIAWDVVYPASGALEKTWSYLAAYADGALFISEFSRQRFQARFGLSPSVRSGVVHLSLDPADYVADGGHSVASDPYWLIVGNSYDHKFLTPTLHLIARAFPGKKLIAVGEREPKRGRRVTQLESGVTDEPRMQALYANAEIVVFPSFYEGFGLPAVNALAYGRTVVVRDTALVREIGGAYRGPGRLIVYQSETELVDRLSRLAHGRWVPQIALGCQGHTPSGWSQVARDIEAFIDDLVRSASTTQMRSRAALNSMFGLSAKDIRE